MYEYLGKEQVGSRKVQYIFQRNDGVQVRYTSAEIKERLAAGDIFSHVKIAKNGRLYIKTTGTSPKQSVANPSVYGYEVTTGGDLYQLVHQYLFFPRRNLVSEITQYIRKPFSGSSGSLCVIDGVRGTGKTTALIHSIEELLENGVAASDIAYIRVAMPDQPFDMLRTRLNELNCRYLFLDDITQVTGISDRISYLSDVVALNRKVVLTGADNFVLAYTRRTSLFKRALWTGSTMVEYTEWSRLMKKRLLQTTLDEYLIYGGILEESGFGRNLEKAKQFLEAAVFHNVRNSLKRNPAELFWEEARETMQLSSRQLTELLCNIVWMSMRPARAGVSGFQKNLPAYSYRMEFGGMDVEFMNQISPGLLSEVCGILQELNLVRQIPNVVQDDSQRNLKRSTDLKFVTLIQSLLYTIRHHTFRPDENDMALLFRNLIISQILAYSIKDNPSARVGYCQYEYNRIEYAIDCVVWNHDPEEKADLQVTAIEMVYSDKARPEFTQYLYESSLQMAVPEITRKLVVYRGETRQVEGIDFVNASDFLLNLKTWLE